jgi:GNAT superfamily N-acetyltransferase
VIVRDATADDAGVVHALTQEAFAPYVTLTPPSGAVNETEEHVRAVLAARPGVLALSSDEPAGCLRLVERDGGLWAGRVAVATAHRGRGVCRALMAYAEERARAEGFRELRLGVRDQLPANLSLYRHLGYDVAVKHDFWSELAKPL